jgi:hypothetical protein
MVNECNEDDCRDPVAVFEKVFEKRAVSAEYSAVRGFKLRNLQISWGRNLTGRSKWRAIQRGVRCFAGASAAEPGLICGERQKDTFTILSKMATSCHSLS